MKKIKQKRHSKIAVNESTVGDTMETQMARILEGNGEYTEKQNLQYTREEDGVIAITDIRADKFDIAIEHTDKVTQSEKKALEERRNKRKEELEKSKKGGDTVGGQTVDTTPQTT